MKLLNPMKGLNKKGSFKVSTGGISNYILVLVLIVVLLKVGATLVPEAQTAGDELNDSGIPLGSLFQNDGVIFVLIAIGILLAVVFAVMPTGKGK